jgi:ectoine hydroxylase-related dioxygenase (phytanoyl-CoA dioxygenase family)
MTVAAAPVKPKNMDLDSHYPLTKDQIDFYQEYGYIKLKNVLSPEVLEYYGNEITKKVFELNTMNLPMEKRSTYQKAFLQITNLWPKSEIAKEFVFSKRMARIAAELMRVKGVRMYHDQALYKEPSGGITPWHADQYYWPLSNPNTVTAWIPLQATPMEMGPLGFAEKSQHMEFGRELAISDTSEQQIQDAIKREGYVLQESPFDLGEISYHSGWTYHRAGPNVSKTPRKVMTIIYMEDGIKLIEPKHNAHKNDLRVWMPGAKVGEVVATPMNPVLYRAS